MKRASYREAVRWIAENDDQTEHEEHAIAGYISTMLVADIFDVTPEKVARDVLKQRRMK